jgi:hypothetical protein
MFPEYRYENGSVLLWSKSIAVLMGPHTDKLYQGLSNQVRGKSGREGKKKPEAREGQ